jgi:uncharacterized SAM-binding protein YcdF (DUF218 family)
MLMIELAVGLLGLALMIYNIRLIWSEQRATALLWFLVGLFFISLSGAIQYYDYHMSKQRR